MGDLIQEISKLSITERIQLVQAILETIAAESAPEKGFLLSKAQKIEIERRSTAIADGSTPSVSWDSIQTKLAERYGI